MFLYGIRRRPGDRFTSGCLPSIIAHGGADARVVTTEIDDLVAALHDLLAQAGELDGYEGLVVIDPDACVSEGFTTSVRAGLARTAGMLRPLRPLGDPGSSRTHPTDLPDPGDPVVAFSAATVELLVGSRQHPGFMAGPSQVAGGSAALMDAVEGWLSSPDRPRTTVIDRAPLPVHVEPNQVSTLDRVAHILAASRQASWAERIEAGVRRPPHGSTSASMTSDTSPDRPEHSDQPSLGHRSSPVMQPAQAGLPEPSAMHHPARPELMAHIPESAQRILVISAEPQAIADAVLSTRPATVTGLPLGWLGEPAAVAEVLQSGPYECILLADALAYAVDPYGLLSLCVGALTPGGRVAATLPNAKHWSHLLPLLVHDRLDYGPVRMLAAGAPLRMFTLVEATLLFDTVGLTTYHFCNGTKLPAEEPAALEHLVDLAAASGAGPGDARTLLTAFQYVIVASRGEEAS